MDYLNEEKYDKVYKLLLLGDSNVGKTSILLRYTDNYFNLDGLSTLGVDLRNKFVLYQDKKIRLDLWDTAGQERFKGLTKNYIKGGHGFVLVFSLIDRNSFEHLKIWINDVKNLLDGEYRMVIIGNKKDCEGKIEIDKKELKEFSEENKIQIFETSAKTGEGIEEAFNYLIQNLYKCPDIGNRNNDEDVNMSYTLDKNTLSKKNKQNCGC